MLKLKDRMPELAGATRWLNSRELKKEDLIGYKPTLIHFWSVSCDICKNNMIKVNQFFESYSEQLNVLAIHMPRCQADQNLEHIQKVTKQYEMIHPMIVDNDSKLTDAFHNKYVPTYYLFDKHGFLRYHQVGEQVQMLHRRIRRLLNQSNNNV